MGDYWVKKANWIKENINTLEDDRYSIILTRHPVDVMRMSDFDKITSCHTPPSRAEQQQANTISALLPKHKDMGRLLMLLTN